MRGLYGAALGGSYLVQVAVQGATHHTPRPPRITTGAAPQLPPRRRYLTVYSTVKGTLRTQKALRRSEEMDLFFLGPTTAQMAVYVNLYGGEVVFQVREFLEPIGM